MLPALRQDMLDVVGGRTKRVVVAVSVTASWFSYDTSERRVTAKAVSLRNSKFAHFGKEDCLV